MTRQSSENGTDPKDAVARYTLGNIIISALATLATWIALSRSSSANGGRKEAQSGGDRRWRRAGALRRTPAR
jgi:hypothetical protein